MRNYSQSSAVPFSEKHAKTLRKQKEEAVPSFFVNCDHEISIWTKNGSDFLKSVSKVGLMTPYFFEK